MPTYTYILPDGTLKDITKPVARRDRVPPGWERVTIPASVAVCPRGEPTQNDSVLNGYKQVENTYGTSYIRRVSPVSIEKIKRIWERP